MTTRTDDEDDKIARDGQTVRTPLMLMDSVQRSVAGKTVLIDTVGHRPGGLPMTDADMQRRRALHMTYDTMVSQRWRTPEVTSNQSDVGRPTGDARLEAHARYQERITNAWRHR